MIMNEHGMREMGVISPYQNIAPISLIVHFISDQIVGYTSLGFPFSSCLSAPVFYIASNLGPADRPQKDLIQLNYPKLKICQISILQFKICMRSCACLVILVGHVLFWDWYEKNFQMHYQGSFINYDIHVSRIFYHLPTPPPLNVNVICGHEFLENIYFYCSKMPLPFTPKNVSNQ